MFFAARVSWLLASALMLMLCAGCAEPADQRQATFPVRGEVSVDGQPAEGALVVFHPSGATGDATLTPRGRVQADGSFQLGSYEIDDGAPAGEYKVTVLWPEPPEHPLDDPDMGADRLNGRYNHPSSSGLSATVVDGENRLPAFQLH